MSYDANWAGREFTVVDTGGWDPDAVGMAALVAAQAEVAINAADAVLFVVDAVVGITDADEAVVRVLRKSGKPVVLAANKVDDQRIESEAMNLWALGIGEPFPIGDRVDANIFDPSTNMVAAATREGTLHFFREDSPSKLSEVETIKTEFGAKTMGFDPKTKKLFLTTSDFGPAPAPTEKQPNPQPVATPGTFRLLIYGK